MKFHFDEFEIDTQQYQIRKSGRELPVEPKVFDVVVYLIQHRDRLVSRDELFEQIWSGRLVSDTTLSNHIKSSRKILGDSGDLQGVIKTIRGRGYQFVADVSELDLGKGAELSSQGEGEPVSSHRGLAIKLVISLAILAVSVILWLIIKPVNINDEPPYVLVVPFSVSSNELATWEPFADQITRELIQSLRKVSGLNVVPPASTFTFKSNKTRSHIQKQLPDVNYVLDGVVREGNNGNMRITVELEDLKDGSLVWDGDFDILVNSANSFTVQSDIAKSVTDSLRVIILEEEKRVLAKVPTSSLPAYELYVQGQYLFSMMTHDSVLKAIDYYSQAVALDPEFEEAYVAKSNAYRMLMVLFDIPKDVLPRVITSTIDVLNVNPESAQARSSLGLAYVHAWLWDDAWRMLNEARARDANLATTELAYALYYSAIGDAKALKRSLARADALDPLNEEIAEWGLWALMMIGEMDAATQWGQEKLQLHPNIPYPLLSLSVAQYINGNYERSIALAVKGVEMSQRAPLSLIFLAQSYAAADQTDKVQALIKEAEMQNKYVCPYETAVVYALMGEIDTVFILLDKAVEYRSNCLIFTRHDPRLRPIRRDPRYFKLLKTIGLDDQALSRYLKK